MTWPIEFIRSVRFWCAAVFAAHLVFAPAVTAQQVVLRSDDNAVAVEGRFLAFDGTFATVLTDRGPATFRANDMTCTGVDCPDLSNYVPHVRLIGDARVAEVLLPALIAVYGRDFGWQRQDTPDRIELVGPDGTEMTFSVMTAPSRDSFEAFVSHNADILISSRELRQDELDAAFSAGLGRLDVARQARILALDALVPVTSPTSDVLSISLSDLIAELSGQSENFETHLPQVLGGQLEGFQNKYLEADGRSFAPPDRVAPDADHLVDNIELSASGLSLLPFGAIGNTQPLALTGPCGVQSQARFLSLKTEDYPLTFPIFLYLPQRPQHAKVEAFLDWLRSPSAQLVIRRAGFVDLAAVPIPIGTQGERLANAIANAGAEIPLVELQRMVRVLSARVRMSSTFRFEPGSTRLDGQSRSNVLQLAQAIRDGQFGRRELLFVGFSDGRGPATANRDLASARAEAVMRDVRRALGGVVPANVTIDTEAFGEALPMACDDTIWGQQTNRRVELWVRDLP